MIVTANGAQFQPVDISIKEARGSIYAVVHRVSRRVYIGLTKGDVAERWRQHRYDATRASSRYYFAASLRAHGTGAFDVYVIEHGLSAEELPAREAHHVKRALADKKQFGFNSTAGGEVSIASHPDVRAKISASSMGKVISAAAKKKISIALTGRDRSPEHRANIGNAHRGKFVSDLARAHMSESHKGKTPSAETRQKMSAAGNARFKRPGEREKHAAQMRALAANPEVREKRLTALRAVLSSDEHRAKRKDAARNKEYTAETRAKCSAAARRRWDRIKESENSCVAD